MGKVLVFGHKSPDTDSVTSAIVMANLERKLGNDETYACVLGNLNKETKYIFDYLNIDKPELLEKIEDGQEVILVDHNEFKQSVDGIENAKILKVVDHHRICGLSTAEPLYYRAEPVGCTATVLYKMYKEKNVEIDKIIATLMLSAIISDTLLFKSPTCTKEDVEIAEELNKIAGLNIEEYGLAMLKAGTDLSDVSAEGLVSLDAKEITIAGKINCVIAQVNTASIPDMLQRKEEIENAMKKVIEEKNLDLFFFAITDIINSNSQVIALGKEASLVEKSYNVTLENNTAFLKGVVSRKKQIIPVLTENA